MEYGTHANDELRLWLAQELHDSVAGRLQELLIEMELLRREGGAPAELVAFQATIRDALAGSRRMLLELRGAARDDAVILSNIERKLRRAMPPPQPPD